MESENVIVYLTLLVAVGVVVVSFLVTFIHSSIVAPVIIIGIILSVFALLSNGKFSHKIENIEKLCFFITLIAIIIAFILLYKPI